MQAFLTGLPNASVAESPPGPVRATGNDEPDVSLLSLSPFLTLTVRVRQKGTTDHPSRGLNGATGAGLARGLGHWQPDLEAATVLAVGHGDLPALGLDETLDDGQAETGLRSPARVGGGSRGR